MIHENFHQNLKLSKGVKRHFSKDDQLTNFQIAYIV